MQSWAYGVCGSAMCLKSYFPTTFFVIKRCKITVCSQLFKYVIVVYFPLNAQSNLLSNLFYPIIHNKCMKKNLVFNAFINILAMLRRNYEGIKLHLLVIKNEKWLRVNKGWFLYKFEAQFIKSLLIYKLRLD